MHRLLLALSAALVLGGCKVNLKTVDLRPSDLPTGLLAQSGSKGFCLSQGNPPASAFKAGSGQVMVGFDHFFKKGADPFPCNDLRSTTFRGGIKFDLDQFAANSIVTAQLKYDAQRSVTRVAGQTVTSSPPLSSAKMLGLARRPFEDDGSLPDDDRIKLGAGPGFDIPVTPMVWDWINKKRKNDGFVLWGPDPPTTDANVPEDNLAEVTWYGNFRLTVLFNPATSPNAP